MQVHQNSHEVIYIWLELVSLTELWAGDGQKVKLKSDRQLVENLGGPVASSDNLGTEMDEDWLRGKVDGDVGGVVATI